MELISHPINKLVRRTNKKAWFYHYYFLVGGK
jgi:hypothetical protein